MYAYEHIFSLRGRTAVVIGAGSGIGKDGRVMSDRETGSIVVLASIRAFVVEPGQSTYAATKAAVVQLVRALACELGPKGVRVNAIAPGVVDTPLSAPIAADPDWRQA